MLVKCPTKERTITSSKSVADILNAVLAAESKIDQDKEHVWVIGLSTRHAIKYIELVTLGTLDEGLIHPRETFRMAIAKGVARIIIAHNHPSGDATPSKADNETVKTMDAAGKIIGIKVLDHVIVGKETRYSYADNELL